MNNCFEQKSIILHYFLNQVKLADQLSLISMKDAGFSSQFIFNEKRIFSETVSPNKHGQICLEIKGDQDAPLVSFTGTPPEIILTTHTVKQTTSPPSKLQKVLTQGYGHHFISLTIIVLCWIELTGTES